MVIMHGAGLQSLGTDNSISTGPYGPCGAWADALWDHPDEPDGIAYLSRHDPAEVCYAVFERKRITFDVKAT
ncbi:RES family NAD+ phosphorylase, partial [Rhizobiaceae sp. 2RAB30]